MPSHAVEDDTPILLRWAVEPLQFVERAVRVPEESVGAVRQAILVRAEPIVRSGASLIEIAFDQPVLKHAGERKDTPRLADEIFSRQFVMSLKHERDSEEEARDGQRDFWSR